MNIDTRQITKNYTYSPRGFLSGMTRTDTGGAALTTGHSYNAVGLMDTESKDGANINRTIAQDLWNIGGVIYKLDTLGRVVKKDNAYVDDNFYEPLKVGSRMVKEQLHEQM